MGKFIIKHILRTKPQKKAYPSVVNNETSKNEEAMTTEEKIEMAKAALEEVPVTVKRLKKDKGLIERTESSKIVITEDNKQLLND